MKIIICGAGQVGRGIAERLATEGNDVTVVDTSPQLVRSISDTLDVQGIVGHGSHPDVLARAGAEDADMIIAVTFADEVNMMACEVANSLFHITTKIARVRDQSYLQPEYRDMFSHEHTSIDVVISPEIAVGEMVLRRLALPGASEAIYFVDDSIIAMGIRLDEDCPVVNTPLSQLTELFPDLNAVVVGISRDKKLTVPHSTDQMMVGDEVFVVADQRQANRVLGLFGHEEKPARRLVIGGAGNIGHYVASKLAERGSRIEVRLIEPNRSRAEEVAKSLPDSIVLHGSALDQVLLREADIQRTEMYLALTNDDKVNILSSLLAKEEGAERTMCLVSGTDMRPLVQPMGIDSVIDPKSVTVSTILQHVRRGRIRGVHPVLDGEGELIEAEALETSPLIGKTLREVELPDGVRLGAIVRQGKVLIPTGDTEIRPRDQIVMFALKNRVREIQHLVRVSVEYF